MKLSDIFSRNKIRTGHEMAKRELAIASGATAFTGVGTGMNLTVAAVNENVISMGMGIACLAAFTTCACFTVDRTRDYLASRRSQKSFEAVNEMAKTENQACRVVNQSTGPDTSPAL